MSDISTGEVFSEEEVKNILLKQPERAKNIVRLSPELQKKTANMNRKERRQYFRQHKKEFEGLSLSELTMMKGEKI